MASRLTYAQKRNKYRSGKYSCYVPLVCTTNWKESDWIHYIDFNGIWRKVKNLQRRVIRGCDICFLDKYRDKKSSSPCEKDKSWNSENPT